ncbi:MAG: FAD:protein FMN transferase [Bacilli bacterium]|nr:FAD:protein FMN transferase [Bacilli bacterium]MBN2877290.1 FAD:protein FMN transferase [Bacilli bacterium]
MKKLMIVLFAIFITLSLSGCTQFENPNEDYCMISYDQTWYGCQKTLTSYFDTTMSLTLYYTPEDNYDVAFYFDYFETILSQYHKSFDNYHEYEGVNNVYTINHATGPVVLDDVLFDAIQYSLDNDELVVVDGTPMFNIALQPVLSIWHDARESTECDDTIELGISYCPVPNDLIDGISFNTNPADIVLDPETNTISFLKENMGIDLGGMAKGYVSKIISDYLDSAGITYLLNTGNSNVIGGGFNPARENGYFYIALSKPTTSFSIMTEYYLTVMVPEGMAVVTSGNNQRFFIGIDDEEVYHHIIDPITNYPGGYSMSVTLLYEDSALADILSTAIYLMPLEDAKSFVNNYDGLEAVWYHYDGTYEYSDGFEQYIAEVYYL